MQSPDGNQLWHPGQSLWSLITEHVVGSELPKIRTALGHSLVNMYTEVHTEAEMWHTMWQESQQGNSRTGTPLPLADPPVVKELVRAEVKMLLQTLRERVSKEGRDGEELLFHYKPQTVDYALSYLDSCYRNCTNPGDTDNGSRPSSHCSVQSNAEDEIEAMRDKLNVTDIDQVVDRLRSVLMEECEALNGLVKHFKGNIKRKCLSRCEYDKSEPTLAELRELRGAIQTDLELYASLTAASPSPSSPLPLKELKNRFRLSAGQSVPEETLRALSTTSGLRPHPLPPLSHPTPRPPSGAPTSRTSASVKLSHSSSLSRTHAQHRSTSASTQSRKTPTCNRITTSGSVIRHFSPSFPEPPEQDSGHCRTPSSSHSFQIKTHRDSPIHKTHLSSHHSIQGSGRHCDLSQVERKSSPSWRSRNIITKSSSLHCDAGGYSSNTDRSVSKTGKAKTQNGQESSCGGSLVSTTVQTDNDRGKSSSESCPAQTGSRKGKNGIDRNKNSHLGKDVTQQQSLVAACTHPAPIQIYGKLFTSPKRLIEDTMSQPKVVQETQTELEFISKFYQPVPPTRVTT